MKKITLFLIILIGANIAFAQKDTIKIISYDTVYEKRIIKIIDTVYTKTDILIKHDTINQTIVLSEYNDLYNRLLDQKNSHYDSSLVFLQVVIGIVSLIIVIILAFGAYLGWNEFKSMNASFKALFKEEKENIDRRINQKTEELTRLKYEKDINELKDSNNNLERFANEASESFSVKSGKEKPILYSEVKTPKSRTNPFDSKKK
jgi:predicted PurR-regulated permease PerM